jgi:hypothetical protein
MDGGRIVARFQWNVKREMRVDGWLETVLTIWLRFCCEAAPAPGVVGVV